MLIGNRIKELRKACNMTLTDLSRKSGVQLATLSRIENLKMTGTVDSHMNIAQALGVDLTELYRQDSAPAGPAHAKPAAAPAEISLHNEQSACQILTKNVLQKKMMPVLLRIEAGGKTETEKLPPGSERFVFILEGEIELMIDKEQFKLTKNSALYFNASIPHGFVNSGNTTTRVVSVTTPAVL